MSHGRDGAKKVRRIADRERAGLSDTDKGLRLGRRRLNLRTGRVQGRQRICRAGVKYDAVERRERASRSEQRFGAGPLARHDDLGGAQPQVDGVEERHVHVEVFDCLRSDSGDQPVGLLPPGVVAGEQRQTDEVLGSDSVMVRRGLVGGRGRADDEVLRHPRQ